MRGFFGLCAIAVVLGACADTTRTYPAASIDLPPIGLAATSRWLEAREAVVRTRPTATEIATEDLCDIVDDCLEPTMQAVQ